MKGIKIRFTVTFIANTLRMLLSFGSALLVARWLGASEYGNFQFLTVTALAARNLTDFGTSSAFFTLISQKNRGRRVFAGYFLWILAQLGAVLAAVGLLSLCGVSDRVWLGQPMGRVLLAVVSAFAMDALWGTVVNVGESARQTGAVQWAGVAAAAAYGICVFSLFRAGLLSIVSVLVLNAGLYAILSVIMARRLSGSGDFGFYEPGGQRDSGRQLPFYLEYCKPILLLSVVNFAAGFADSWFLQHFGGSRQQGYFGVGQQLSTIALLTTASFIKIFWKETAEAISAGDMEGARSLYQKACRLFYFIAAAISAFLIPVSPEIVRLVLGDAYAGAAWPLALMLLYPLHQTLGQLNGTFFFASAQVRPYVKLAIPLTLLGLPVTYVLLADSHSSLPGLGLGAVGLPIKLVLLNVLAVNANSWLICRLHAWKFEWRYQVASLCAPLCVSISAVSTVRGVLMLLGTRASDIPFLGLCAFLYALLMAGVINRLPSLYGLSKEEYLDIRGRALSRLKPIMERGISKFRIPAASA